MSQKNKVVEEEKNDEVVVLDFTQDIDLQVSKKPYVGRHFEFTDKALAQRVKELAVGKYGNQVLA